MKEFVDKLIGRLNNEYLKYNDGDWNSAIDETIKIVNELAEEYINTSTTNAQIIRSMTDEELAAFLCKVKADYQWVDQNFPREDECDEWVMWLQSEVEGVTENE